MEKTITRIGFTEKQLADLAKERVLITGRIVAVIENKHEKKIIEGVNIVTNDGDKYYAQMACAESPTVDFDGTEAGLRLGNNNSTPSKTSTDVVTYIAGTAHALDATYEKSNDSDADNTGAGVDIVTWRFSYLTSEGNGNGILEGAICNNRTTPANALTHFKFAAAFDKTSSDTLKVFVNHQFNGV